MPVIEVVTRMLSTEEIWAELAQIVAALQSAGVAQCDVVFGWPWGLEYYADDSWAAEAIPVLELLDRVRDVERRALGVLGDDDLFVSVDGLEIKLCHEGDIHLEAEAGNLLAEQLIARWATAGVLRAATE